MCVLQLTIIQFLGHEGKGKFKNLKNGIGSKLFVVPNQQHWNLDMSYQQYLFWQILATSLIVYMVYIALCYHKNSRED